MAKVECWFKQDLKKPVKVQTLNGSVFTLDNVGSLIGVEVYSDGEAETLTGSVTGYIILPDETTVSVAGTRSENKAYIALPQSALAYPGFIRIAIKLTNSSEITTLLAVVATVAKSRTDTLITPSSQVITDWSQQIAAEMQAVEDASAAQDIKIGNITSPLINDATFKGTGNLFDVNRIISGKDISTSGVLSTNANRSVSDFIPVNSGDVLKFYAIPRSSVSTFAPYTICAFDSHLKAVPSAGDTSRPNTYTVPSGIRFIRFSYYNTTNYPMVLRNVSAAPTAYVAYQDQTAKDNDIPGLLSNVATLQTHMASAETNIDSVTKNVGSWYFENAVSNSNRSIVQFSRTFTKAYVKIISAPEDMNALNVYASDDGFHTQTILKSYDLSNTNELIVEVDPTGYTALKFTFSFTESTTGTFKVIVHGFDGVSIADRLFSIEDSIDELYVPGEMLTGEDHQYFDLRTNPDRIASTGEDERYHVRSYEVNAGQIYVLSGFTVSINGSAPLVGFGVNEVAAGKVIQTLITGSTTRTDYYMIFKAPTDGYIYVAWVQGKEELNIYSGELVSKEYNSKPKIKIQLFGDSITDNKWGDQWTWANYIAQNLTDYNVTVFDDAVGGSGIGHGKSTSTSSHQTEDYNYVHDLVTDGETLQTDANCIVILVGTNNWKSGTTIGDMSSTGVSTIYGALKGILEYISEHTKAKVFVCTIPQRYNSDDQSRPKNDYGEPLYNGVTLAEFCEPFRKVSAFYGMPCIHLNESLGWNRININNFTVDGLHPNLVGDKMIASIICAEIRKHMGKIPK